MCVPRGEPRCLARGRVHEPSRSALFVTSPNRPELVGEQRLIRSSGDAAHASSEGGSSSDWPAGQRLISSRGALIVRVDDGDVRRERPRAARGHPTAKRSVLRSMIPSGNSSTSESTKASQLVV